MILRMLSRMFIFFGKKKTAKILEKIKKNNLEVYNQVNGLLKSIDPFAFESEEFQCSFAKLKENVLAFNYKEQDARDLVFFSHAEHVLFLA